MSEYGALSYLITMAHSCSGKTVNPGAQVYPQNHTKTMDDTEDWHEMKLGKGVIVESVDDLLANL